VEGYVLGGGLDQEWCVEGERVDEGTPQFTVAILFHRHLDVLERTLPRSLHALTDSTGEAFEVVLHCDGTPDEIAVEVLRRRALWNVDEVRFRRRAAFVASGDASNNGHRRLFAERARYLVVIEDDVLVAREEPSFDVLGACRALFERYPDVPVICKVSDHDSWAWRLEDVGPDIEPGVRSVNRVATHFIAYDTWRFRPVAERFGAFDLDVFIDRDDWSYNWEDVVSHVGTTGGRRIAWPERWPLKVFHCDRKVEPGSMYNTQDPAVKHAVLDQLDARLGAVATERR
jgi:hypothetical protein